MKILITSGATREPIDGVRFISNFSTGATGAALADCFLSLGQEVVFLAGIDSVLPKWPCRVLQFSSFQDLNHLLQKQLAQSPIDWVVHAAAVGDYSVADVRAGKMDSRSEIQLTLKPNFKIVERLKSYASKPPGLIAFKLTHTNDASARLEAVNSLFQRSSAEYVIHNDYFLIQSESRHQFWIHARGGVPADPVECGSRDELARRLAGFLGLSSVSESDTVTQGAGL